MKRKGRMYVVCSKNPKHKQVCSFFGGGYGRPILTLFFSISVRVDINLFFVTLIVRIRNNDDREKLIAFQF